MSKINVSVDCVIFGFDDSEKKLKVLTIEKKVDPFSKHEQKRTQFAIPGDLIELDEDIDQAANRILYSLTKLDNLYLRPFVVQAVFKKKKIKNGLKTSEQTPTKE